MNLSSPARRRRYDEPDVQDLICLVGRAAGRCDRLSHLIPSTSVAVEPATDSFVCSVELHVARHKSGAGIARHPGWRGGGHPAWRFRMKLPAFKTKGCRCAE